MMVFLGSHTILVEVKSQIYKTIEVAKVHVTVTEEELTAEASENLLAQATEDVILGKFSYNKIIFCLTFFFR